MSALATVAWKSFSGIFTAKIDFLIGAFYVTIADADIGSLQSLPTLFDKSKPYKILCFLTKNG